MEVSEHFGISQTLDRAFRGMRGGGETRRRTENDPSVPSNERDERNESRDVREDLGDEDSLRVADRSNGDVKEVMEEESSWFV